ncbi:MAG TPA: outer membrane protein transport protein [Syntrophorhabdaceae bacterium]|nr:outer membrane protein transport protein [Syntrophorhabdaceae bacterium]MDI9561345.1 outer membrane protein transport protein [Pseudomonadota bacterium]OQC49223.1 MAG: 47 kDa outer membrane protein precursor [Deltaproteobacteria bacterium ADurb.Bin026]MBP8697547.1 outer membrane protein transport protein [Syntrophorhabdaceae bacterium]MBV6505915.1 47 kDa outer membrane protein [Syntrophorhabdaceae bacterium]
MKKINIILFLVFVLPSHALGAAFLIYNQDAKANGMGMAVISSIDNPSAVFYNPAMLVFRQGFSISAGDTMIAPSTRYETTTGKRYYSKTSTHHLPTFFAKHTHNDISFGIGVYSPFGLSTEWPRDWAGSRYSTFAELKTTYINPVFAFRVNDIFSFGFGVSYIKSSVKMKQNIFVAPGLPDGESKLTGDGDGIGYNAGITIRFPKDYTLSFTYRSPTEIKFNGKAFFFLPPPLTSSGTVASTTFTLPFIAVAGLSKKLGAFIFEGDILYTGWSSMSSYRITSNNGTADSFVYKNWRNTPSIALGINFNVNKYLDIRGGYMYDKSPVPGKTLGPELPDSARNIFTIGGTLRRDAFKINFGYQATFFEDRYSYIQGLHGKYTNFAHLFLVGLEYSQ